MTVPLVEGDLTEIRVTEEPRFEDGRWYFGGKEFRLPIRKFWVDVRNLQVRTSASDHGKRGGGNGLQPFRTNIIGDGTLSPRRATLGIIGEDVSTNTITVIIEAKNPDDETASAEAGALLYHSPADWELGSTETWGLNLILPQSHFGDMLSLVRTDRLTRFSVGVDFENVYSDDYYAPPSVGTGWYLPPSKSQRSFGDWGVGRVKTMNWIEGESEPAPEPNTEFYGDEPTGKAEPWKAAVEAIHGLGKDIRAASTHIVWWTGILLSTTVVASLFK